MEQPVEKPAATSKPRRSRVVTEAMAAGRTPEEAAMAARLAAIRAGAPPAPAQLSVFTYSPHDRRWVEMRRQPRRFDTITLPAAQKAQLLDDLRAFQASRAFYEANNIPYRRGYFLYGPPGTGKTSIGMAIATEARRPIYFMPPDMPIDAINTIPHNAVVLFEDADKMITNKDAAFRQVESEPVPVNTSFPTINQEEHGLWLKAIRANEKIAKDYDDNYAGIEANFEIGGVGGTTIRESAIESTLNDMKKGYPEPRASVKTPVMDEHGNVTSYVERVPAETEAEFAERRAIYRDIIREANRLRQEHYDTVRFDQERVGQMLQIVDGALTPYGAIFVMSTNKRFDIHGALVRSGRMDVALHIDYLDEAEIESMLDRLGVPTARRPVIIKAVRVPGRAHQVTAADLQGAILDDRRAHAPA